MSFKITRAYRISLSALSCVILFFSYYTIPLGISGKLEFIALSFFFAITLTLSFMYQFATVKIDKHSVAIKRFFITQNVYLSEIEKVTRVRSRRLGDSRFNIVNKNGRCVISYVDYFGSERALVQALKDHSIPFEESSRWNFWKLF